MVSSKKHDYAAPVYLDLLSDDYLRQATEDLETFREQMFRSTRIPKEFFVLE